jgi:prepilin-type N-terminal cleavage/methylation domain-containing protein
MKGFTLIELIVIMAIIGILSLVVISSCITAKQKAECIEQGLSEDCYKFN